MQNIISKWLAIYSRISFSNHLIVIVFLILISNWIIVGLKLPIFLLLVPIAIIFFLTLIRGSMNYFDIEINNNGSLTNYTNVKYKIDKKKGTMTIVDKLGNVTMVNQGNYTIKPHTGDTVDVEG